MKADVVRRAVAVVALAASIVVVVDAQAPTPTGVIAPVERFAGTWFEISAYGSWWQRRCVRDTTLAVTPRSGPDADLRSRCRTVESVEIRNGRLHAPGEDGQWRAHFAPALFTWLPAVWGDFWVIGHDDSLSWFVVGARGHQRLAIYSRTIAIDEAAMAQALALARRAGFDVERLARTRQDPDSWREAP